MFERGEGMMITMMRALMFEMTLTRQYEQDGTGVDDVDGDTMALQSIIRRGGGRRSEETDGKAAEVSDTVVEDDYEGDPQGLGKGDDYDTVEVGVEITEYVIFVEGVLVGDGELLSE